MNHTSTPMHHTHTTSTFGASGVVRSTGGGCARTIVAMLVIVVIVVAIGVFVVVKSVSGVSDAISGINSNTNSSSGDLQNDPTVIADIAVMHAGLDSRIPSWQAQNDTIVHHVPAADAGLPANFNTKEVVYGHCTTSQFYLFVLNVTAPEDTTADTEGYEFVPGGSPATCAPVGWHIMSSEPAAADWFFVTIDTTAATATPAIRPAATATTATGR